MKKRLLARTPAFSFFFLPRFLKPFGVWSIHAPQVAQTSTGVPPQLAVQRSWPNSLVRSARQTSRPLHFWWLRRVLGSAPSATWWHVEQCDHGRSWSTKVDQLSTIADHGRPWSTMLDHARPCSTMVDHARPWSSTRVDHGRLMGRPWSNMVEHGQPRSTMIAHVFFECWCPSPMVEHGRAWSTMVDQGRL